jgi:hypothetical protein
MNLVSVSIGFVILVIAFIVLSFYLGAARTLKRLSLMAVFALAYFGAVWLWGDRGELWFGIIALVIAALIYLVVSNRRRS